MSEGWRVGRENGDAGAQSSLRGGIRSRPESKLPHSATFADSTGVGDDGASGRREQRGPVQEQGLPGNRLLEFGLVEIPSERSTELRSM